MDMNKVSLADRVIGISAIVVFIFTFLPQFGKGPYTEGAGVLGWLAWIFAILMLAQVIISNFTTTKLPTLPISWDLAHLVLGIAAFVFVLLEFIIGRNYGAAALGMSVSVGLDRLFGLVIVLLASIGLGVGGFLRFRKPSNTTPPAA